MRLIKKHWELQRSVLNCCQHYCVQKFEGLHHKFVEARNVRCLLNKNFGLINYALECALEMTAGAQLDQGMEELRSEKDAL